MITRFIAIFMFAFMLAASAPAKAQEAGDIDPIEGVNRAIFAFNKVLDTYIVRPIAWTYRKVVPDYGRERVNSFFTNLGEPINFANAVLQGDTKQAFTTFWRFALNSTVGIGGIFDQAKYMNLPYRKEDFGQTMGTYGMGPSFYLMLPILGPSSGRDAVGRVADWFTDPVSYVDNDWVVYGLAAAEGINDRARILDFTDQTDRSAIDPYATYRSTYLQYRADLIKNGDTNGRSYSTY